MNNPVRVSFDDEPLILVDEQDELTGYAPKASCHSGQGILHRAFSIFLFDADGRLLLQQRSPGKPLWPGFWTNTCCSHPRRGENREQAAHRRLGEELGLQTQLRELYTFQYHARYLDAGSESEVCSVFVGGLRGEPSANPTEVAALRFIKPAEMDQEVADAAGQITPWCRLEWARLRADFWPEVEACRGS